MAVFSFARQTRHPLNQQPLDRVFILRIAFVACLASIACNCHECNSLYSHPLPGTAAHNRDVIATKWLNQGTQGYRLRRKVHDFSGNYKPRCIACVECERKRNKFDIHQKVVRSRTHAQARALLQSMS